MSLTPDLRADLRRDLGDPDALVFSDLELDRLFERADSNYAGTMVLAIRQILTNAAKLFDYRTMHSEQKQSQVFDHLKEILKIWEAELEKSQTIVQSEIKFVGLKPVPSKYKLEP